MRRALSLLVFALYWITPLDAQQVTIVKVDLGRDVYATQGTVLQTWNDVHLSNWATPFQLVSTSGKGTGWMFGVRPGTGFWTDNWSGTTSPAGALASLPSSATRDSLVNRWTQGAYHPTIPQGNSTKAVIELRSLDPNTVYELTFSASRVNVADVRTVDYAVLGLNGGLATLDVANNVSELVEVPGILPDAGGRIEISVEASASNTTPERYFYLGAMQVRGVSSATPPAVLGFDQPGVRASRPAGSGPFAVEVTAVESVGAAPAVSLSAIDEGTGQAPTWLALPSSATANSSFALTLDGGALAEGLHRATVTGTAAGYPDFDSTVELVVRDPDVRNVLWYGNSFSAGQGCYPISVPELFQSIAEEAGHASPNVIARLVGSTYLSFHLNHPIHAEAIADSLKVGEAWDRVVLQGFSTEATETLGNPAQFRADAAAIFANVRAHSPSARLSMFQTWARAPGHSFYPDTFAEPYAMHEEVRRNYRLCVDELNQAFGAGAAVNAAVGDAIALHGFDPAIYCPDLYHGGPELTLTAAMVIYTTVYGQRACSITPDFSGPSPFATQMQMLGLTKDDWEPLAGIADRVADGSLRLYPGSGEDALLRTGVAALDACPLKRIDPGDVLTIRLETPVGLYNGAPALLFADLFPTGSPPGPWVGAPEIRYDPSSAWVLASTPSLQDDLFGDLTIPPWMVGRSLLVQGHLLAPSVETGNPFTTTDAHELRARPVPSRNAVK
jgi:hypothetical protein